MVRKVNKKVGKCKISVCVCVSEFNQNNFNRVIELLFQFCIPKTR